MRAPPAPCRRSPADGSGRFPGSPPRTRHGRHDPRVADVPHPGGICQAERRDRTPHARVGHAVLVVDGRGHGRPGEPRAVDLDHEASLRIGRPRTDDGHGGRDAADDRHRPREVRASAAGDQDRRTLVGRRERHAREQNLRDAAGRDRHIRVRDRDQARVAGEGDRGDGQVRRIGRAVHPDRRRGRGVGVRVVVLERERADVRRDLRVVDQVVPVGAVEARTDDRGGRIGPRYRVAPSSA